jgi:transposase
LNSYLSELIRTSSARRKTPIPHDPQIYRQRNRIERMFGRLKDFRRIATRYDNLATTYLAAIVIAATLTWWT